LKVRIEKQAFGGGRSLRGQSPSSKTKLMGKRNLARRATKIPDSAAARAVTRLNIDRKIVAVCARQGKRGHLIPNDSPP